MLRLYKREGGLKSYAGTSNAKEIEEHILAGDEELKIVYDAYIYQIAKGIGSLASYQWFSRSDRFDWWGSLFKDRRNRIRKTDRFYRTNRSSTRGTRNDRFI